MYTSGTTGEPKVPVFPKHTHVPSSTSTSLPPPCPLPSCGPPCSIQACFCFVRDARVFVCQEKSTPTLVGSVLDTVRVPMHKWSANSEAEAQSVCECTKCKLLGVWQGVILTQKNLLGSSAGLHRGLDHTGGPFLFETDTYISFLPMAHSFEINMQICCIIAGQTPLLFTFPPPLRDTGMCIWHCSAGGH